MLAAPVSATDGGLISTTLLDVTVVESTESPVDNSGTDETATDLATQVNPITASYIDDGISESTGATQGETSGEPGDDDQSELSYDSPREEQADDKRCISAKLIEKIRNNAEMNNLAANTSVCPWEYTYDVNPFRIPEVLVKAVCFPTPVSFPPNERCEPVSYPIPVRKMDGNRNWVSCTESLAVGCVLANTGSLRTPITPTNAPEIRRPTGDNPSAQTPSFHDESDTDV